MQTAFLEFGSNSIKYYLLETSGKRAGRIQEHVKIPWDLGMEVFQGRPISARTISSCLSSLESLRERFPGVPLDGAVSVGTAALREASNGEELRSALRQQFGLRFHVIEGGLEAHFLEVDFKELVETYPTVVFDLGGGSVELVEFDSPNDTCKISLPVGAIRLHCQLAGIEDRAAYVREGRAKLSAALPPRTKPLPTDRILGTGGTVRAIAKVLGKSRFEIGDIAFLLEDERAIEEAGLEPHRRRLLLPGTLIIERLFSVLGLRRVEYKEATVKHAVLDLLTDRPARSRAGARCG